MFPIVPIAISGSNGSACRPTECGIRRSPCSLRQPVPGRPPPSGAPTVCAPERGIPRVVSSCLSLGYVVNGRDRRTHADDAEGKRPTRVGGVMVANPCSYLAEAASLSSPPGPPPAIGVEWRSPMMIVRFTTAAMGHAATTRRSKALTAWLAGSQKPRAYSQFLRAVVVFASSCLRGR